MRRWLVGAILPALLAATAAALALQVADEARLMTSADATDREGLAPVTPAPLPEGDAAEAATPAPPFSIYAEVLTRPLFFPTRRPLPTGAAAAPTVAVAAPPLAVTLRGIAVSGADAVALASEPGNEAVRHLRVGDEIGGWRVEAVGPEAIVLGRGAEHRRLALDFRRRGP